MRRAASRSLARAMPDRAARERAYWQAVRRELRQVQSALGFSALVEPHPKFLAMHPYWTHLRDEADEF